MKLPPIPPNEDTFGADGDGKSFKFKPLSLHREILSISPFSGLHIRTLMFLLLVLLSNLANLVGNGSSVYSGGIWQINNW